MMQMCKECMEEDKFVKAEYQSRDNYYCKKHLLIMCKLK